ncbi:oxoglutarate-dependent flavonoid 7-O-demethylase 1-like [Lycium ferocissimum]|uniref:oxoglutarate-dependent flavonoid 7-O-demethylase 1-like n=1 Tax=Lycium ferocissimum TaxID=112874 RepID=UPI002814C78E|nr:oxoglutarate-dependent flavonoid 7-O-demethylase 1-like [Lycium ferocissimum]
MSAENAETVQELRLRGKMVNEIEGLQIKKNGAWIPVSYLPNTFVVYIGDILEVVTNGVYKALNIEQLLMKIRRGPAPDLLTPQSPAKFKRIGVADYFKGFASRQVVGKSYIDTIRIRNGDDGSN